MWLEQVERSGRAEALRPSRLKEWLGPLGAAPPLPGTGRELPPLLTPLHQSREEWGSSPSRAWGWGHGSHLGKESPIGWVPDPL